MRRRLTALLVALALTSVGAFLMPEAAHARKHAQSTAVPAPLLGGFRVKDITWATADAQIGPGKVTREFYGTLPTTFSDFGLPLGVKIVVSYKTLTTNVAAYLRSIPAGRDVELAFHHEPEGDYTTGAQFVSEFNGQEQVAHAAAPAVPFDYIGLSYHYMTGQDTSWLPPAADRYYVDSYQRGGTGYSKIQPLPQTPQFVNFAASLKAAGHRFDGFTEYGRGVIPTGGVISVADVSARQQVYSTDRAYIDSTLRPATPHPFVWAYWYTSGSAGQWRLLDGASQQAWRSASTTP